MLKEEMTPKGWRSAWTVGWALLVELWILLVYRVGTTLLD